MRSTAVVLSLVLTCVAFQAAHADEMDRSDRAFVQRIADAVRRQPDFGSQQAAAGSAAGSLAEAKSEFFPRIQLLVDSGEDRTVRAGRAQEPAGNRRSGQINPQLAVSQLLYDGGAAWGRVRAAQGRVRAASRGVDVAANSLALLAVQTHFAVLRQREAVKYAEENLRKVQSIRDKVAGRAAAGRDPRSELARLDSRVLEARSQLMDARRELGDVDAGYEEFFGEQPGELRAPVARPSRRSSADAAISFASVHNPELIAFRDELAASAAELETQRATTLWPRLSLEATGTAYDALGNDGGDNRDTYVGVRVSYDAFDGGARLGRLRQANSRVRASRLALERAELALERRMRQTYAAVEARARQIGPLEERVEMDHGAIDDYEELFLAGRRSLNDLIVAQRDYFASAMQFLEVQFDLRVQEFAVPALTGELAAYFGIGPQASADASEGIPQ